MSRRILPAAAGWLAAAAAAVLAGVGAVQLIGAGTDGEVLTPQQVAEQLEAAATEAPPALCPAGPWRPCPGCCPGRAAP